MAIDHLAQEGSTLWTASALLKARNFKCAALAVVDPGVFISINSTTKAPASYV